MRKNESNKWLRKGKTIILPQFIKKMQYIWTVSQSMTHFDECLQSEYPGIYHMLTTICNRLLRCHRICWHKQRSAPHPVPKRCPGPNSWNLWTYYLPSKGVLPMWLSEGHWNWEIVLGCLGGPMSSKGP